MDSDATDDDYASSGEEEAGGGPGARPVQDPMGTGAAGGAGRYGGAPADEPTTPTWLEVRKKEEGGGRGEGATAAARAAHLLSHSLSNTCTQFSDDDDTTPDQLDAGVDVQVRLFFWGGTGERSNGRAPRISRLSAVPFLSPPTRRLTHTPPTPLPSLPGHSLGPHAAAPPDVPGAWGQELRERIGERGERRRDRRVLRPPPSLTIPPLHPRPAFSFFFPQEIRMKQFRNYVNLREAVDAAAPALKRECVPTSRDGRFFAFARNSRSVRPSIVHFQLRNLVWATSPSDVYTACDARIVHWNGVAREKATVLDLSGEPWAPPLGPPGPGAAGPLGGGRVQVGTCTVAHGLAVAGGFNGEVVVKPLTTGTTSTGAARSLLPRCSPAAFRVTLSDNGITNGIEVVPSPGTGGGLPGDPPGVPASLLVANNDNAVRLFDAATLARTADWALDWAANWATACPAAAPGPAAGLVAIVGDDPAALLADGASGRAVARLAGHADYSFAAAWHPGGTLLATGNQDTTARVWDVRRLGGPALATLAGAMGAVRSLRWSPDGRFLAAAEPADFVRVFDAAAGFERAQEIDLFGEVAGIAFSPGGDRFFVGVSDATYSSLLQFNRAVGGSVGGGGGWVGSAIPGTAAAGAGDEEEDEENEDDEDEEAGGGGGGGPPASRRSPSLAGGGEEDPAGAAEAAPPPACAGTTRRRLRSGAALGGDD